MKKSHSTTLILSLLIYFLLSFENGIYAQSGDLDPSFGTGGKVLTDLGSDFEAGRAVAIQEDGKIVVAGYTGEFPAEDFAVVRYNPDGSLDASFGTGGIVITDILGRNSEGYGMTLQNDGKIIVVGASDDASEANTALVRYNSNGTTDNTFDDDGIVITDLFNTEDFGYAVVVQDDNKILVGGFAIAAASEDFALIRYNEDGTLDNTFGSDGIVTTDFDGFYNIANCMLIQDDGKIVLAGFTTNGLDEDFAIARYNSNGSLDNSFDGDGKVTTDFDASEENINSIALQSSGKLIVGGYSFINAPLLEDFIIARYNINGSLDNTFGSEGFITTDFNSLFDKVSTVLVQSDDKIIAAGYANNGTENDIALTRYNSDGTLDDSFGDAGKVITDIDGRDDRGNSAVLQSDNKIVVSGRSVEGSNTDIAVCRYLNDIEIEIAENILTKPDLHISPNPFSTILNISATNSGSIDLYDNVGNKVMMVNISGYGNIINTNNIPAGIYLLRYFDGTSYEHHRLVKY